MRTIGAALLVILIFAVLAFLSPQYLFYADVPQKSDAIVLFLGNEFKERKSETIKLMEEGYASYFVIPAYGRIVETQNHEAASKRAVASRPSRYPSAYEDTHVEIIEAKRLMDSKGLKSAIFVSSPYHMRRIKIIADSVFPKETYQTLFVPTRFEKKGSGLWFRNEQETKKVLSEYSKIAWFMIYSRVM